MPSGKEYSMKISEILDRSHYSMSFEVFPPKTDSNFASIETAAAEIASLRPSFLSITHGASGSTSKYSLELAKKLKKSCDTPILIHYTCVNSTREDVKKRLADMKEAGFSNIMALRGDIPEGTSASDMASWEYRHASDLAEEIRRTEPDFCIGGACYPEIHPESPNRWTDIENLKRKVEAGCEFLTTQMFFDNNIFFNFMYKLRNAGISVPVVPGIMPITKANQVKRAIELSGSFVPQRFKALVDRFGQNDDAMEQAGIAYATDQIIDLYANGVPFVHVYSMNKPEVARAIKENVSHILGQPTEYCKADI